jgi:hypothetical protein
MTISIRVMAKNKKNVVPNNVQLKKKKKKIVPWKDL